MHLHNIIRTTNNRIVFYFSLSIVLCWSLTACNLLPDDTAQATRSTIVLASITPTATQPLSDSLNATSEQWYDALPVMYGICFEAAWDAAEQVFTFRTAEEHIQFYNLADNSELCRQPVERYPFDFSRGDILTGIWNRGLGCTAEHTILDFVRDDVAQTITIRAQFITEGDCPYELVRGLWLGIEDARNYAVNIEIVR